MRVWGFIWRLHTGGHSRKFCRSPAASFEAINPLTALRPRIPRRRQMLQAEIPADSSKINSKSPTSNSNTAGLAFPDQENAKGRLLNVSVA